MESTINIKLDFSGLQEVKKTCKELSKTVEVGILHNSEEAQIGALQHFGGVGRYTYGPYEGQEVDVPPRPFLASAMEHFGKDILESEVHNISFTDSSSARTVLDRVGDKSRLVVQGEIDSIAAMGGNSPRTIETKGKDSPLIDKGNLRASIEYEVRK